MRTKACLQVRDAVTLALDQLDHSPKVRFPSGPLSPRSIAYTHTHRNRAANRLSFLDLLETLSPMRNCSKTCNITTLSGTVYQPLNHIVYMRNPHIISWRKHWGNGNQRLSLLCIHGNCWASGTPSISPSAGDIRCDGRGSSVVRRVSLARAYSITMHSFCHSFPSFVIRLAPFVIAFLIYFKANRHVS